MLKKKIKVFFFTTGIFIAVALANPLCITTITNSPVEVQAATAPTVEPRADEIRWVYRELTDGRIQRRRWNYTRGYWVDPYWITVG